MEKIKEKVFASTNIEHKINNDIMYKLIVFYNKVNAKISIQVANFALNLK